MCGVDVKWTHRGGIGMRFHVCVLVLVLIATALHAQTYRKTRSYIPEGEIEENRTTARVIANDPRPLLQVIGAFEKEYGWMGLLIDYEDPPYESKYDLVDDTAPQWRAEHPGSNGVTVPSGGYFESTYSEVHGVRWSSEKTEKVLNKVVHDYNRSGNPGGFIVRKEENGRYAIVGTAIKDGSGHSKPVAAILDTPISLVSEERSAAQTLTLICERLSARVGSKVEYFGFGGMVDMVAVQSTVTVGGENVPARTLLLQTVDHMNSSRIWRLSYDADAKEYALGF